jgi:hypothetical protein
MSRAAEDFGRHVIGPITAEFCLRLWAMTSMLERPNETAALFCARGGLRMMLAYDRFLAVTGLDAPARHAGLMISRLVAIRSALAMAIETGQAGPALASVLEYEFRGATLRDVVRRTTDIDVGDAPTFVEIATPTGLLQVLTSADGRKAKIEIEEQASGRGSSSSTQACSAPRRSCCLRRRTRRSSAAP